MHAMDMYVTVMTLTRNSALFCVTELGDGADNILVVLPHHLTAGEPYRSIDRVAIHRNTY